MYQKKALFQSCRFVSTTLTLFLIIYATSINEGVHLLFKLQKLSININEQREIYKCIYKSSQYIREILRAHRTFRAWKIHTKIRKCDIALSVAS